jgi:hypothetical protein
MNWISVNERVPNNDRPVVFTEGGNYYLGSYIDDDPSIEKCFYDEGFMERYEVSHWMELPALPIERTETGLERDKTPLS